MQSIRVSPHRAVRPVFTASRPVTRSTLRAPPARHNTRAAASGFEGFINQLSVAIKNSPLNQGKKALAIAQAGDYNVEATKMLMEKYIAENDAKGLLTEVGAKYTAVELNTMENGPAIRAELAKLTDRTSMPNVFIKGASVGGCNDGPGVMTLQKEGKLVPMLQAAGAL